MIEHKCHAWNCPTAVAPRLFMCLPHWRRLPYPHKKAVLDAYRTGQEVDKLPSLQYRHAAWAAIIAMAEIDGVNLPNWYRDYGKLLAAAWASHAC